MSWQRVTMYIIREVEVEVTLMIHPEEPQTWTDPGDPGEVCIEGASLPSGAPTELDKEESEYVTTHAEKHLAEMVSDAEADRQDAMYDRWKDRTYPF